MSDAVASKARGLAARLWEYQAERFPVFKHGVLIAAFGTSAVCLSALLRGAAPEWLALVVAVLVLFGLFFQLRVADEHKDNEDDTKYRPERPVPRGLVTLGKLRVVAIGVGLVQVALTAWLDWTLLGLLLLVWAYMAVMTKEFFVPAWLKKRPIIYMVSHMAIMPLIDLYATACDWLPAGVALHEDFGLTLGAFLLLSLVNGSVRKERNTILPFTRVRRTEPAPAVVNCSIRLRSRFSSLMRAKRCGSLPMTRPRCN